MKKISKKGILIGKLCLYSTVFLLLSAVNVEAQTVSTSILKTSDNLVSSTELVAPVSALDYSVSKAKVNIIEYAIMRDVSNSSTDAQPLNSDVIFRKVVGELGLKDTKKGVILHTLLCGASRLPEVRVTTLPQQEGWMSSSSERTKHLRQFLTKAKADIRFLAEHPADQPQTNLYRALVHLAKQFSKESTEKKIIVISDGAEVSSVFNANEYYRNPEGLLTDFDKIIEQFQKDSPLPDLTGVEFVLVTPGSSDFHLWLSRFWVKFVQMQGGSATVRATF